MKPFPPRIHRGLRERLSPADFVWLPVALLVIFIGWLITTPYGSYLPPDFNAQSFLRNKEAFFYRSGYFLGFFLHIVGAPIALVLGAIQMFPWPRKTWPKLHRVLGRGYVLLMLFMVAPGGIIMSFAAYGGWISTVCFAAIGILSGWYTFMAWRTAQRHRYHDHARWMMRSYLMMCSAVFLRLINITLARLDWDHELTYQLSAWLSWVPQLLLLEWVLRTWDRGAGAGRIALSRRT